MDEFLPGDELIMKYLDREMSSDERLAFESSLQTDASLKSRFESLRLAVETTRLYALRQQIASVHGQLSPEMHPSASPVKKPATMRSLVRYSLAVAATILVIAVGVGIFYSVTPGKVYDELYVGYSAGTARSGDSATTVEKAYNEKNLHIVDSVVRVDHLTEKETLLTGIAYLDADSSGRAATQFAKLLKGNSTYRPDAEFYLALAQLKQKRYKEARKLMQRIHDDPAHPYHSRFTSKIMREAQLLSWK